MTLHRRASAILFVGILSSFAHAQEPNEIANWTAPPFWMPPKAEVSKSLEPGIGRMAPEAVEGGPAGPLAFTAITPCRIVDTRGNGFTGAYGPPSMAQGAPRDFALAGRCGIPAGSFARAISLNITVTNTQGAGFILIYPKDAPQPNVSTLNYVAGQTVANAAVVQLNADVATVVAGVSGTDLIIDTNGYYAPQTVVYSLNGLSSAVQLLEGTNISITPSGQTLTVASTVPAAWSLTGNAGTTPGTNFLGTTDNQPLEIKVNNQRIFRLEPNATTPRVIGGHADNNALAGVVGATIGGGGALGLANVVTDSFGTVAGGRGNRAGDNAGTLFDASFATVSGGLTNTASAQTSTVGGGQGNIASGQSSTVGGGQGNIASGVVSTIAGGNQNTAVGMGSFAAGTFAHANHDGAFVWGDNSSVSGVSSTGINQFIVRAAGGIWLGTTSAPSLDIATNFLTTSTGARLTIGGAWTNSSDSSRKENFEQIDKHDVLARVGSLPITRWSYKAEGCSVRHLGPTGQDFAAAFGLGTDDTSIATVDADGVALTAIQALYEQVQELRKRLAALEGAKD